MERESSEFLRALRGQRSQIQLARRLGYRGNPITDWERGERFPTAPEMLRVATVGGIDVVAAFAQFSANVPLRMNGKDFALAEWLSDLCGSMSVAEFAARCKRSRFSVSRWLHGTTIPRVPDLFRMIDAATGRLAEWVAEFVPIERVPSLEARYRTAIASKRLAFEAPWSEAALRLLETDAYAQFEQHPPGFLSACLGLSVEQEEDCIRKLVQAGLISRRRGKYCVLARCTVDTRGGKEALHRLKQHWTEVAARRLRAPKDDDFFAYNVMSLSRADFDKVRQILRSAFREIRSLVATSHPESIAALVNLQLVSFSPTTPAHAARTEPTAEGGTARLPVSGWEP